MPHDVVKKKQVCGHWCRLHRSSSEQVGKDEVQSRRRHLGDSHSRPAVVQGVLPRCASTGYWVERLVSMLFSKIGGFLKWWYCNNSRSLSGLPRRYKRITAGPWLHYILAQEGPLSFHRNAQPCDMGRWSVRCAHWCENRAVRSCICVAVVSGAQSVQHVVNNGDQATVHPKGQARLGWWRRNLAYFVSGGHDVSGSFGGKTCNLQQTPTT